MRNQSINVPSRPQIKPIAEPRASASGLLPAITNLREQPVTAARRLGCLLAILALARGDPPPTPLPDPLLLPNGTRVTTAAQWRNQRRPELLAQFTREMYGVAPPRSPQMSFVMFDKGTVTLNGKALRKQITVLLNGDPKGPKFDLLLYLPKAFHTRVPAILGLNFWGNHTIAHDPGVRLPTNPMKAGRDSYVDLSCVENGHATEACRGINSSQWPVDVMLDKGYALATVYCCDIDPDTKDGFERSLKAFYPELRNRPDNFSTIGEWAWVLSRSLDYLVTDSAIDPKRVAVFGWSRLGKAALWAGATDDRFAAVISNESGAGGAKLFRRGVGESVADLNKNFPYWFDQNFRKYNGLDRSLPFDQHELIALIAPRPVYIASAEQDKGADPEGEFAAAKAAEPVYKLLGKPGLLTDRWPAVNQPIAGGDIAYHVRAGRHDVKPFDWQQYLTFLDRHFHDKTL